jgi:hypothetical protein
VSVAIGVTALAKKAEVLFRREVRIMVVVRGSEFGFACEINHCAFLMPVLDDREVASVPDSNLPEVQPRRR